MSLNPLRWFSRGHDDNKNQAIQAQASTFTHSSKIIKTESDLIQSVTFTRPLAKEINLTQALVLHICPLETRKDSKQCVILTSAKHKNSEELRETVRLLASKGFKLAPGANIYVVESETTIHAVARGHIDGQLVQRMRNILGDKKKAGYYQSFEEIVRFGVDHNASDIHLNIFNDSLRSEVRFTIEGKYVSPERFHLPTATLEAIAGVAYQTAKGVNDSVFNPTIESQCRIFIEIPGKGRYMLRWANMATDEGAQITMRITPIKVNSDAWTLEGLGYVPCQVEIFKRAMCSEGGAIIVSGVVDSGKSTLIATLLGTIPSIRKVMTLEDPRENILPGRHFHQNTVSRDLETEDDPFISKRRTIKRTALNDLFIGELRDLQTGELFQDSVEAGTNVYTTLHAPNCMGIASRLISPTIGVNVDAVTTPGTLKLLVYQALLPKNCPKCKLPAESLYSTPEGNYWMDYFGRIERLYGISHSKIRIRNPQGCPHCQREGLAELNGLKGRTAVAEMIEPDDYFLESVRDSKFIELSRHLKNQPKSAYDDPDMTGKSAMECAIYKMSQGEIDPREIEPRFETFVTVEMERARQTKNYSLKSIETVQKVA